MLACCSDLFQSADSRSRPNDYLKMSFLCPCWRNFSIRIAHELAAFRLPAILHGSRFQNPPNPLCQWGKGRNWVGWFRYRWG